MAWASLTYKVLPEQITGALPRRSVTGIVGALTHEVEAQFHLKKVATLVTVDVEGAFDATRRF